jgi:hypothetical protein
MTCSWRCAGFIKPTAIRPREPPSVLSPFAQLRCYLRWRDVSSISSEGVTPPSSLLRAHVPLPLDSLLLRHLASFEESLQVVRSPCCPRELPDVISESLSLDAGSHAPAVHHVLSPVSSMMSSAFPTQAWVGFPRMSTNNDFSWEVLEVADIPLRSGLQVCSPPRSFLPLRVLLQGSRGFYIRAYRALLPPHAPDMLTVRTQVIDGTGTLHPVRLSALSAAHPVSRPFVCECHTISTVPRFQPPPRRTQHADFPHCALLSASPQGLWDLSCWGDFRR